MFSIFVVYVDGSLLVRKDDFLVVLDNCKHYLEDADVLGVKVWYTNDGNFIMDYWKEI